MVLYIISCYVLVMNFTSLKSATPSKYIPALILYFLFLSNYKIILIPSQTSRQKQKSLVNTRLFISAVDGT